MKKITKILVPVDFSQYSENALIFAIKLADKINATLHVLHIPLFENSVGESPASLALSIQEQTSESRIKMKNFVDKITDDISVYLDKKPIVQTIVSVGKVELKIIDEALSKEIDYIIMGTQGHKSTVDRFLGTMASNIVKNAPCSVMVIPKDAEFKMKFDLGYATDFSEVEHSEIRNVIDIFEPFNPAISCVHFNDKQVDNREKIKDFKSYFAINIPELNIEFHNLPVKNSVEFMNFFVENQNINMLVMYKPKRTFFESIFHISFTQQMARHITIPLLVIKQKT